jgi:hypothetical protein
MAPKDPEVISPSLAVEASTPCPHAWQHVGAHRQSRRSSPPTLPALCSTFGHRHVHRPFGLRLRESSLRAQALALNSAFHPLPQLPHFPHGPRSRLVNLGSLSPSRLCRAAFPSGQSTPDNPHHGTGSTSSPQTHPRLALACNKQLRLQALTSPLDMSSVPRPDQATFCFFGLALPHLPCHPLNRNCFLDRPPRG